MNASSRPPLLHVTNGESAGNTLRQTTIGGAVLAWQDTLHEGPVPAPAAPGVAPDARASSADCGWGSEQSPARHRSSCAIGSCSMRSATTGQVVLWFEHDLYDQLQLLDVLALAHAEEVVPD